MGERLAAENIELLSFLALGCVFTLTKIDIQPVLENHNTSNKVKPYLEDTSPKELESYPLSTSFPFSFLFWASFHTMDE